MSEKPICADCGKKITDTAWISQDGKNYHAVWDQKAADKAPADHNPTWYGLKRRCKQ